MILELGRWVVIVLAASVLHEATHYVVAAAAGREPVFDLLEWAVIYEADLPPGPVEYAIAAAPVVVGLVVGLGAVLLLGVGQALSSGPYVIAWIFYTVWGAITNDFDFREVGADAETNH